MGFDLIVYGLVMAGLGMATARFAPSLALLAHVTAFCACAGGLAWGVLAMRGRHRQKGTIATLAVVSCLALALSVSAWQQLDEDNSKTRVVAAVTSLMLFLSIGQTVLVARREEKEEK
jgi:hypothetical protein